MEKRLFVHLLVCTIAMAAPLFLFGQSGCPGCLVSLPAGLPVDTVYLPPIPDGQVGQAYGQDISFRMPKTTTPVSVIDPSTPAGITINSIEIVAVEGLPAGLTWEANQTVFPVATQTDGCIRICGTPTASDSFVITVKLKASIFFITQNAQFPMRMYVAPGVSINDGFSMTNPTGCGNTTVAFTNNIPSNGQAGFTYEWDFGDNTNHVGEQPPAHTYNTPGTYVVRYKATIDTVGYILQSAQFTDLDCSDNFGLNNPDVYLNIKDSAGVQIYNNIANYVNNASFPVTFVLNLPLGPGNYTMQVWDEDSGLQGGDDLCGQFPFNILSNGNIVATGVEGSLTIVNPVYTYIFTDTVVVYPSPAPPLASPLGNTVACSDQAPLLLESSYSTGNQWLLDGLPISEATDSVYAVTETGVYTVRYTSPVGCTAVSPAVSMTIHPQPALPIFSNNANQLALFDTAALPNPYFLQWYLDNNALPSNGFWHCATESGNYALEVLNPTTGCRNRFELNVFYNPNADCTTGIEATDLESSIRVLPNPVSDMLLLDFGQLQTVHALYISDAAGRVVFGQQNINNPAPMRILCSDWPAGIYFVQIAHKTGVFAKKIAKQ
jgi:hypothetical protein